MLGKSGPDSLLQPLQGPYGGGDPNPVGNAEGVAEGRAEGGGQRRRVVEGGRSDPVRKGMGRSEDRACKLGVLVLTRHCVPASFGKLGGLLFLSSLTSSLPGRSLSSILLPLEGGLLGRWFDCQDFGSLRGGLLGLLLFPGQPT